MKTNKKSLDKLLDWMEVTGNKLPDPVTIFFILCLILMFLSFVFNKLGVNSTNPSTNEIIYVSNLLAKENLQKFLTKIVTTFQTFPPLGVVLVAMIGIGLAEKSGMLEAFLHSIVTRISSSLLYFAIAATGIIFTGIGDACFVILPPLAAIIFLNIGKHPIIGILLAYAGAAVGFSSGLFVGLNDVLLTAFSIPAAQLIKPNFNTTPALNMYFNITNTILQVFILTWITKKFVEPRFKTDELEVNKEKYELTELDKKGLKYAGIVFFVYSLMIIILCLGKNSFFRDASGSLVSLKSPLMGGLIPIMSLAFFLMGVVYGKITGTIKNDKDVVKMIGSSLGSMGGYIFIVFIASQFIYLFICGK